MLTPSDVVGFLKADGGTATPINPTMAFRCRHSDVVSDYYYTEDGEKMTSRRGRTKHRLAADDNPT